MREAAKEAAKGHHWEHVWAWYVVELADDEQMVRAGLRLIIEAEPDIEVVGEYVHELADGRRFLLLHGDEFDQIIRHQRWIAVLGDVIYDALVRASAILSWIRRRFGVHAYWSLAGYAKRRVKRAMQFIFDFEASAVRAARQRGLDGIVCGHIHSAAIREVDGLTYVNCGDWVDSCTAIVEHFDGRLELIAWGLQDLAAATVAAEEEELVCAS